MSISNKRYFRDISLVVIFSCFISLIFIFMWLYCMGNKPVWMDVVLGIITSLLASVIFYLLYYYSEERNNDYGKEFKKVKRTSQIGGEEYWIQLIDDLDLTSETAYFYGRSLEPWLTNGSKKALKKKLKNICKKSESGKSVNQIYFISYEESDKLETFLKEASGSLWNNSVKQIILRNKAKSQYAIVLCHKNMAVTLKTPETEGGDCPVIEIKFEIGGIWDNFKKYLEKIVEDATNNNMLQQ